MIANCLRRCNAWGAKSFILHWLQVSAQSKLHTNRCIVGGCFHLHRDLTPTHHIVENIGTVHAQVVGLGVCLANAASAAQIKEALCTSTNNLWPRRIGVAILENLNIVHGPWVPSRSQHTSAQVKRRPFRRGLGRSRVSSAMASRGSAEIEPVVVERMSQRVAATIEKYKVSRGFCHKGVFAHTNLQRSQARGRCTFPAGSDSSSLQHNAAFNQDVRTVMARWFMLGRIWNLCVSGCSSLYGSAPGPGARS